MEIVFTECVGVTDSSSVGEVRRSATLAASKLALNETRAGELAILASEVARNVLAHGGGGQVILTGIENRGAPLAQIVALDRGAGIDDVAQAMRDGYSTGGTMGVGLGSMKRLATCFEIYTGKGGTPVLLELGENNSAGGVQVSGMTLPYPGERVCGDGWWCEQSAERTVAILADGLGHGIGAAEAAQEAIATVRSGCSATPGEILSHVHDALKKTRGAVAAVVEICPKQKTLTYAGVGNISAVLVRGESSKSFMSHNGTLGMNMRHIQEIGAEWNSDCVFVMHSDGLQTRWDLAAYPGLQARHPALIAGVLVRDFRRHRDDAGVVVMKGA
jgi:anti-sigma regulatory factor (Ser/Thr protein kinase)